MTTVVSHDAGGAEILSSLIRREKWSCRYALAGPAVAIFERKLGPVTNLPVAEAVQAATRIVCGTSWPALLELEALALAREQSIPSVAFLDHWINYDLRFTRDGGRILPDQLWVGDLAAHRLAQDTFPSIPVRLVENPYRLDIIEALQVAASNRPRSTPEKLRVLYVTEPTAEHAARRFGNERYWGYTETEALQYFLSHLGALRAAIACVVVRPHPSEVADKYAWATGASPIPVIIRSQTSLVDEVAEADVVVGCNSMAMVVGVWGGKRTVCSIPPGGRGFSLGLPGIDMLASLVESAGSTGTT